MATDLSLTNLSIKLFSLPPKRQPLRAPIQVQFQLCERRLVLSAQMLYDVLGDHALQTHVLDQPLVDHQLVSTPVHTQASAAHNLTGLTQVQQQFGLTGKGQTVAVIDSGIAWDHVALGKGFGAGFRVVGGWDFTEENDANPYDDGPSGYHGTHVAGIIGNDDPARGGVAPDVDLVALRVFNDTGQSQMSWVEKALQWVHNNRTAFENPITTVNMSLGSTWNSNNVPSWAILEDELRVLHDDGILVTASAGNSFKDYNAPGLSYPAASSYVLPVASVDDNGQLSDFSQRSDRVIAAPGRNIISTVPDHLLGRDGKINDFSSATGTSMAAPYVAGAAVLVRQAMEMAGWNNISPDTIADHFHKTADHVFDTITKASYDRLDLQQAIDAIIPDDNVPDSAASASTLNLAAGKLDGWINSLGDSDFYRFTAEASGKLQLDADSDWVDSLRWTVSSGGRDVDSGDLTAKTLSLVAGQSYELRLTAGDEIGPFRLGWSFQAQASGASGIGGGSTGLTQIGPVDYFENTLNAGQSLRAQATEDGTFSVQWRNPDSQSGQLSLNSGSGAALVDSTWENGSLRLDVQARAGQWFDIRLPGSSSDQGELAIANVLLQSGKQLQLNGTSHSDSVEISLQNGLDVSIGKINYHFAAGQIDQVNIDSLGDSDSLRLTGSERAENFSLNPSLTTLESSQLSIRVAGAENVTVVGGGGPDQAYLYDTDGDDLLNLRPTECEMVGAGYRYNVVDVDRIFIDAKSGGQDIAYVYDSAGDDRLAVRPQFTSITGTGFYNYVSGFERVYAYATAGGTDTAEIYDSIGDDRFTTNGESASVSGPGFASYTKFYEHVNAHASAGGNDIALLYGASQQTQWQKGADFISFNEGVWDREARGFETVQAYVAGQAHSISLNGAAMQSFSTLSAEVATSNNFVSLCQPTIQSADLWSSSGHGEDAELLPIEARALNLAANDQLESNVLAEGREHQNWLADSTALYSLDLIEDPFLSSPALERQILDEIFRLQDELNF